MLHVPNCDYTNCLTNRELTFFDYRLLVHEHQGQLHSQKMDEVIRDQFVSYNKGINIAK